MTNGGPEGAHQGPRRPRVGPRPGWGGGLDSLVHPLAPFGLYLHRNTKPSRTKPFFTICSLFSHRRRLKIGAARRPCPGTLPEGGFISGSFSIAMDASRMSREYSTLDHGSMISSYVISSLQSCASLL